MSKSAGVYAIANLLDGHLYVGSSVDLGTRKSKHFGTLMRGEHPNPHLQAAYNLYGVGNFEWRVLLYCDRGMCRFYEQRILDRWQPHYNISPNASSREGVVVSAETRAKMSAAGRGRTPPNKGKRASDELRAKLSAAHRGKSISAAHRERLGAALRGRKNGPPSAETRRRISESKQGRPSGRKGERLSETQRAILRAGWEKRKQNPEWREALRRGWERRRRNDARIEVMSE